MLGFVSLNICQFVTAANDNILKQVLIFGVVAGGVWGGVLGEGAQAWASLCLAVPYVLLSGFAGQFADRFNKRDVCIVVNASEVAVALLALVGFWMVNLWIVLLAMILISIQSTFFTPAKFGILPEIVETGYLSRANGTVNMFTYIAVIFGSAVGGPIYDAWNPSTAPDPGNTGLPWLPGGVVLLVALVGLVSCWGLPRLKPRNPGMPIRAKFFKPYLDTWRGIRGSVVATVIVAWSFFYLIVGGIAILILPDYKSLLDISAGQTSILMVILGISTGLGDFVAGRVSGLRIRPQLIAVGGIGTTVMFFVLAVVPLNFVLIAVCLSLTGFLAGFAMVPLQTMTQRFSVVEQRGQVLGLWNCLSFVGVIIGNFLFLGIKYTGLPSNRVFAACGILGLVFVALYFTTWRKTFARGLQEFGDADDTSDPESTSG